MAAGKFVTLSDGITPVVVQPSMKWEDLRTRLKFGDGRFSVRRWGAPGVGDTVIHAEKCVTRPCIAGDPGLFEYCARESETITGLVAFGTTEVFRIFGGPGEKCVAALVRPRLLRSSEVNFIVIGSNSSKSSNAPVSAGSSVPHSVGTGTPPRVQPRHVSGSVDVGCVRKEEYEESLLEGCPYCSFDRNSAGSAPSAVRRFSADGVDNLRFACRRGDEYEDEMDERAELMGSSRTDLGVCPLPGRRDLRPMPQLSTSEISGVPVAGAEDENTSEAVSCHLRADFRDGFQFESGNLQPDHETKLPMTAWLLGDEYNRTCSLAGHDRLSDEGDHSLDRTENHGFTRCSTQRQLRDKDFYKPAFVVFPKTDGPPTIDLRHRGPAAGRRKVTPGASSNVSGIFSTAEQIGNMAGRVGSRVATLAAAATKMVRIPDFHILAS